MNPVDELNRLDQRNGFLMIGLLSRFAWRVRTGRHARYRVAIAG
jgi:hypothetical protein